MLAVVVVVVVAVTVLPRHVDGEWPLRMMVVVMLLLGIMRPLAETHSSPPVHASIPPILDSVVAPSMQPPRNLGPPLAHLGY